MTDPKSDTKPRPPGLDKPWVPRVIKVMSDVNTWLYRKTGGRLGRKWRVMAGFRKPVDVLLLTVVGRRSGQPRTVPLLYLEDGAPFAEGGDVVVVASSGGLPEHPQWYRNLLANDRVTVQVGRDTRPCLAEEVDDEEKARLWPQLLELYADFATYDAWTEREIPVIRLRQATDG